MKKNNLLLVFIIFTTISLFFAGCSFEAIGEHQNHDENGVNTHFKKEKISFKTFSKNPKLMGKLDKNKETLKSITSNKIISSTDQSFFINTNDALYIEDENGLHSYTFAINRNLENVFLENLVIQLQQDGTYKSFIVSYNITEQELEDLKNGTLSDINNKISLQVIDDENFTSGFANKILYEPCITGSSQTWKCSQGVLNHAPGNPGPPNCIAGSFEYVINVNWGICSVYTSDGDNVPVGTTTVNTGGGGTPSNSTGTIKTDAFLSPELLFMKDFVKNFLDDDQEELFTTLTQNDQNNVFIYLFENAFTLVSQQFIKDCLVKINQDPNDAITSITPFLIEKDINDSELYPCSKNILNKLKNLNQNDFANIIARLGNTDSKYSLKIKSVNPTNPLHVATTNWETANGFIIPFKYIMKIRPSYESTATTLSLTSTILHEFVHAYFLSLIDDCHQSNNCDLLQTFPELWNYYVAHQNSGVVTDPVTQHEQIALSYVNIIAAALQEYEISNGITTTNPQVYNDLAWGGLIDTYAFINSPSLTQSDKDRIIARNYAEAENLSQTNPSGVVICTPIGTPCN